jgi:hypothetical protein
VSHCAPDQGDGQTEQSTPENWLRHVHTQPLYVVPVTPSALLEPLQSSETVQSRLQTGKPV